MSKKPLFFLTLFSFVFAKSPRNVDKKGTKSQKSDIPWWFVFFKVFNILGWFWKISQKNWKNWVFRLFSGFFIFTPTFFSRLVLLTYRGDFAKKANQNSEKMKLFCSSRGSSSKKQVSVIYEKIDIPREMKKNSKKTRFFSLFFVKKHHHVGKIV